MGFFSEDMLPMLGVYEAETSELMSTLDGIVSRVERDKAFAPEDIAELFRCAHTIKGSSAMMGLDALSHLTHKVEDLFDLIRSDPDLADGRVPDILDHLYSFSDYVSDELQRMSDDDYAPADAQELIESVSAFSSDLAGVDAYAGNGESAKQESCEDAEETAAGLDPNASDSADEGELDGATLKISFKPDVAMVNARALVIVKQLGGQVDVKSCVPDDLTDPQAAQTIADDGLLVVIAPADIDKAKQFLAKNSSISRIGVLDDAASVLSNTESGKGSRSSGSASVSDKFVTLRWNDVRDLQDMAGEFLLQTAHLKALSESMPEQGNLRSAVSQAARLVDDLVYHINKMSMVSMSAMVPQLSRMVRDMCRSSGKQVSFEVQGGDIEIDRNLYNSISDPLLHIIRNSVDHGIEAPEERLTCGKEARGKVTLSIENLGARVAFRVSDDGRGIDVDEVLAKAAANGMLEKPASQYSRSEILRMVMLAGLSTSKEVTQYSGRGVGMDVVNAVIREFDGHIDIESEVGKGTSMRLYMPVSVTSVACLGFRIGDSVYHMPLFNLSKIYVADDAADLLSSFEGSTLFTYEKHQIPLLDVHRLLDCQGEDAFYIVCHSMEDEFAIGVDEVLGEYACANKPLPSCLGPEWQARCAIRNAAIMEDGTVAFALNAALLATLAQGLEQPDLRMDEAADTSLGDFSTSGINADEIPEQAFMFSLGSERYAISVEDTERLISTPACAKVPRGLPHLRGLTNYRNHVIAVFDLAKSAGVDDDCPYVLVVADTRGEQMGFSVTSADGVCNLKNAVLADDQPAPRELAGSMRLAASLVIDPKEPPVNLLVRG